MARAASTYRSNSVSYRTALHIANRAGVGLIAGTLMMMGNRVVRARPPRALPDNFRRDRRIRGKSYKAAERQKILQALHATPNPVAPVVAPVAVEETPRDRKNRLARERRARKREEANVVV